MTDRQLILGYGKTGRSLATYFEKYRKHTDIYDDNITCNRDKRFVNSAQIAQRTYERAYLSPGFPRTHTLVRSLVDRKTELSNDVHLFRENCRQPVLAVTGSNGKSSVTSMMKHALKRHRVNVALGGNIGKPAIEFLQEPERSLYILELSSFQLETNTCLPLSVSSILNISADHMDRYTSYQQYVSAKQNIYSNAKHIVVNYDDQATRPETRKADMAFSSETTGKDIIGFSRDYIYEQQKKLLHSQELQVVGKHNIANINAALAILAVSGYRPSNMLEYLSQYRGLAHRFELIATKKHVRYINDSKATNTSAARAALASVRTTQYSRLILIAGGDNKGADIRELVADIISTVSLLLLIGKSAHIFFKAVGNCVPTKIVADMQQAVEVAAEYAQAGDVVLLSPACSSLDMFASFEQRGNMFTTLVSSL